jgi:Peptidase family M49
MTVSHAGCVVVAVLALALMAGGCEKPRQSATKADSASTSPMPDLEAAIRRFAPTEISADTGRLAPDDRRALEKIIEASAYLTPLFLRQVWSGNDSWYTVLQRDTSSMGRARLHYFRINAGPWSRLDGNVPFIAGVPREKPPQAGYYPDDITKPEFERWVTALPTSEREKAEGFFYVIRRNADRSLRPVPYSDEYRQFLEPAARLLREAAALTPNGTLRRFLTARADAFASNDYYASDVAWMDLDAPIDVTIGPYETYEDQLFGYKAGFEAYVTLRDDAESAKLQKFSRYLQELENHLPLEPRYRNPKLGAAAPIRVVDEVFASGDGNHDVQTAAFNLPNDERVVREKGSKRVMLKNVQEAKFNKTLVPIADVVLSAADRANLSFEPFFTHILAHELMHGLGPHGITVDGRETTVRKELKELYSAIEESKADATGLWAVQYLIDKGVVDKAMEQSLYTTYLASMFRSVRFGINEAHGKGVAMQFNYLMDAGAIAASADSNTFEVIPAKIKDGVTRLTRDLLTLEAEGSYAKAAAMLGTYAVIRPLLQRALDRLKRVPVDIEPAYPLARHVTTGSR